MTTSVRHEPDCTVLAVMGELDFASAPQLREMLLELCGTPNGVLVVDCSRLDFIDSTGIGLFVAAQRRLAEAGSALRLINVSPKVGKPLKLGRVDEFLDIRWSDEPAAHRVP